MTTTHFTGPLEIGIGGAPVTRPTEVLAVPLTVTAVASTAIVVPIPACRILRVTERTLVAFTAATITLALGTTVGGEEIVAAVDIKAKAASRALTLVAASADVMDALAAGNLHITMAQGTPTAVGSGVLLIEIQRLGDA